jgi:hypothetical protein
MLSHGSTALEVHDVGQPFGNLFRRAAFGTVGTPQLFRVPAQHRSKIHSTNPLERLNKEVYPSGESRLGEVNLAAALMGDRTDVRTSVGKGGCHGDHYRG